MRVVWPVHKLNVGATLREQRGILNSLVAERIQPQRLNQRGWLLQQLLVSPACSSLTRQQQR